MASAIGLDIGSSAVRAVQLSRGRSGQVRLQRLGQVMLPADTVVAAEIAAPEAVTQALGVLWREFDFKGRKVALGLTHPEVVVKRVDLPSVPVEGLRDSLLAQAQDHLPLDLSTSEFDYQLMEEYQDDDGAWMMRVLLVAADSTVVRRYLDVVEAARLRPVLLDLDAFAQIRALRDPVATEERFGVGAGELIVDIGAQLTNIVVHTNGTPRFVRLVPLGGDSFIRSGAGTSTTAVDWLQAQPADPDATEEWPRYARHLGDDLTQLIEEVRNAAAFYRSQAGSVPVDTVVLTGGGSTAPRLDEHFAVALGVPVAHGDPLRSLQSDGLEMPSEELEGAKPFLSVAVGLALGALR